MNFDYNWEQNEIFRPVTYGFCWIADVILLIWCVVVVLQGVLP